MARTDKMPITLSHAPRAPFPTPIKLTNSGMMIVVSIPGKREVAMEVSMARLSRCLLSSVESGTIKEWLSE